MPRHNQRLAAMAACPIRFVDGNGILPMRAMPGEQYSARFFRHRAHQLFEEHWWNIAAQEVAVDRPVRLDLPAFSGEDAGSAAAQCEIDGSVPPVHFRGGARAAEQQLEDFATGRLRGYAADRNRHPEAASGLSPYLHFGHIGIHQVAQRVLFSGAPAEDIDAFLEEAVIRRELSFNFCHFRADHREVSALPRWALATLDAHRGDLRRPSYSYEELERGETGDPVWNLAQRALLRLGTIQGYLRMLWGKRILEWTASPEEAVQTMIRLHDRWAIDGRDPNTYAGILWCLGKHDRPWAPERPIFGSIRYMSSEATRRKVDLKAYERLVDQDRLRV